jgi:hypothetical protein
MWWLVLLVSVSAAPAAINVREYTGTCSMFRYCYVRVDLPDFKLVTLEIAVTLENQNDRFFAEYSKPRPVGYASYDKYPTETIYDFVADLNHRETLINEVFPVVKGSVYVRIDGGLNWDNQMMQAYTVHDWRYTVKATSSYCESDFFTAHQPLQASSIECALRLNRGDAFVIQDRLQEAPYYAGVFEVPRFTEELDIKLDWTEGKVLLQHGNMPTNDSIRLLPGLTKVRLPSSGQWYVLAETSGAEVVLSAVKRPCYAGLHFACYSKQVYKLINIKHNEDHTPLKQTNFESKVVDPLIPQFPIKYFTFEHKEVGRQVSAQLLLHNKAPLLNTQDLKELITTDLFVHVSSGAPAFSSNSKVNIAGCHGVNCQVTEQEDSLVVTVSLGYLEYGLQFITIGLTTDDKAYYFTFEVALFTSTCDRCSGDECVPLYDTYVCACLQNHAGLHCRDRSFSDSKYLAMVVMLCLSNFTMLPAVYFAYKYHTYGEMTVYLCNMVVSALYHVCDSQYYCFDVHPFTLLFVDFFFSFFSILVSIVYLGKLRNQQSKMLVYVLLVFFLMTTGLESHYSQFSTKYLVSSRQPPLLVAGVILARYFTIIVTYNSQHHLCLLNCTTIKSFFCDSRNFTWKWGLGAIGCFVTALLCNLLSTNNSYWLTHSCWHIFVMLTAACVIKTLPLKYLNDDFYLGDAPNSPELAFKRTSFPLEPITSL